MVWNERRFVIALWRHSASPDDLIYSCPLCPLCSSARRVMDGLESTAAIRLLERTRGVPPAHIIAVSANTTAEDLEAARLAGMDDSGALSEGAETRLSSLTLGSPPLNRRRLTL